MMGQHAAVSAQSSANKSTSRCKKLVTAAACVSAVYGGSGVDGGRHGPGGLESRPCVSGSMRIPEAKPHTRKDPFAFLPKSSGGRNYVPTINPAAEAARLDARADARGLEIAPPKSCLRISVRDLARKFDSSKAFLGAVDEGDETDQQTGKPPPSPQVVGYRVPPKFDDATGVVEVRERAPLDYRAGASKRLGVASSMIITGRPRSQPPHSRAFPNSCEAAGNPRVFELRRDNACASRGELTIAPPASVDDGREGAQRHSPAPPGITFYTAPTPRYSYTVFDDIKRCALQEAMLKRRAPVPSISEGQEQDAPGKAASRQGVNAGQSSDGLGEQSAGPMMTTTTTAATECEETRQESPSEQLETQGQRVTSSMVTPSSPPPRQMATLLQGDDWLVDEHGTVWRKTLVRVPQEAMKSMRVTDL